MTGYRKKSDKEFVLVKFEDDVLFICQETRMNNIQGVECSVKYTDGGRYPARILARNSDKNVLIDLRKQMEQASIEDSAEEIEKHKVPESQKKKKMSGSVAPPQNIPSSHDREVKKEKKRVIKREKSTKIEGKVGKFEKAWAAGNKTAVVNLFKEKRPTQTALQDNSPIDRNESEINEINELPQDSFQCPVNSNDSEIPKVSDQKELVEEEPIVTKFNTTYVAEPRQPLHESDSALSNVGSTLKLSDVHNIHDKKLDLVKKGPEISGLNTACARRTVLYEPLSDPSSCKDMEDKVQKKVSPATQNNLCDETHDKLSFEGANDSEPPTSSAIMSDSLLTDLLTDIEQTESIQGLTSTVDQSSQPFTVGAVQINCPNEFNTNKAESFGFDSAGDILDIATEITIESGTSIDEAAILEAFKQPILLSTPNETEIAEDDSYGGGGGNPSYVIEDLNKKRTTQIGLHRNSSIDQNESGSKEIGELPQDSIKTLEDSKDSDFSEHNSSGSAYVPSANGSENNTDKDSTDEEELNRSRKRTSNRRSGENSSLEISLSVNVPGRSTRDDAEMFVTPVTGQKGLDRRSYCMFCKTMQSKFVRHLENKHKTEIEVKKFISLPRGNRERLTIIDAIRKQCMFDFNTNNVVNDGELMVCRRPNSNAPKTATHYKVCQNCKGFFSKNNLRHHAKKCFGFNGKKNRTLSVFGRRILGRIHAEASDILRKEIFPVLREDDIVRLIRYDRLIILYGNKLSAKYGGLQHQHDMIRSHLRLLGRFLCALKGLNNDVSDFASVYQPKMYDDAVLAIQEIAGFDAKTKTYKSPSTAYSIGSLLKKVANFYIYDCIKREDVTQKNRTEDFLKLLNEDIGVSVNKNVMESQTLQKRRKKVELPAKKDIQLLHNYLKDQRTSAFTALEGGFNSNEWLKLAQSTLTSVQLFNRRRAGEIERVFIEDFQLYEGINADELKKIPKERREIAENYVRFTIRGKLNRTVSVLLTRDLLKCIEKILQHRTEANVPSTNRYVFGIPGTDKTRNSYLRACALMRKFAKESGVSFPHKLTGTTLRKHIATNCINLNLSENEVADVAKFMGHADKIHRDHYRQPIVSREILRMSKVLELAQGESDEDNESDTDSENEGETPSEMPTAALLLPVDNKKQRSGILKSSENIQTAQASERKRSHREMVGQTTSKTKSAQEFHSENSESDDMSKRPTASASQKKKKRSTSPYGPVGTKKRWSIEDKELVLSIFESNFKTRTFPSLSAIRQACLQYPSLKARNPAVIKTWISNQYKK